MNFFFLLLCFLCCFFLLYYIRKQQLVRRVQRMDPTEKINRLNAIMESFGFLFAPDCRTITSSLNAWQRDFGYSSLFDYTAPRFQMIFDCEPVYFDYDGRTWLVEFWKGQYGITTGCEIGLYSSDSVIEPHMRQAAHFSCVTDADLLPLGMHLFQKGNHLFSIQNTHWWLTGFCPGTFCQPQELSMDVSITFPNCTMLQSFVGGLIEAGYSIAQFHFSGYDTVHFTFSVPRASQPRWKRPWLASYAQWKNRQLCRLYRLITAPFTEPSDQFLYLYYLLPILLRRLLNLCGCRTKYSRRKPKTLFHQKDSK